MRKRKINLKLSSLFAIVFCWMLSFLFSNPGTAQTIFDPHVNCVNGCTAKDIKNIASALVDPVAPYNLLPASFSCISGQNVSVRLAVFLTTSTQKAGIYVYANIRNSATNEILGTLSECFSSGALTTVGDATKVVFNQTLTWVCGSVIKLTDVYVAWGTGNSDFCQGIPDPRCPATTSKCFALAAGEYIPIVIPTGNGANQTRCSTNPGENTATFDLTASDATIIGSQTGVHVRWYSDAGGLTELTGTGKTAFVNTSNPQTVYAKVCNNPPPGTVCSGLQNIILTVIPKPVTLVLTGSSICTSAPNTGTITSSTSVIGVSYQLKDGSDVNVQIAKAGTNSGLTWTGLAAGNGYYVVATGGGTTACQSTSTSVNVLSVTNPVALVLTGSSICTSVTGTGSITSSTSVTGVNYQLYNSSNATVQGVKAGTGSGLTWSNVAAGTGYYAIATGTVTPNCTSGNSNPVNVIEVTNPAALVLTGSSICTSVTGTGTITSFTSVTGVNYQLYNSSNATVQGIKAGTGSGLTWNNVAAGTGYYAIATGTVTPNCTSPHSNPVNVVEVANPTTLILTGSSICSSAPGTGTVSSTTSQSGVSYQLKDGSNVSVQSAKPGTGSGLSWTGLAAGTNYHVVSTGASPTNCSGSSNNVDVSQINNPPTPTVTITEPSLCGAATATLTVTNPQVGATYTVTQASGGISPAPVVYASGTLSFPGLIPGKGFSITASVGAGACVSGTTDCDHLSVAPKSPTPVFETQAESQTTVKAYPNPFSDRVKFLVTTPVAGNGSLEIYNMTGQKIKTIYTGYFAAGGQVFEFNLPAKQVSSLVYVLRIGDKKVTGKLVQLNDK